MLENYKDDYTYGHTGNFLYVKINKKLPKEEIIKVKITGIDDKTLIGEVNE